MFQIGAFVFDFYGTLVEVDQDAPPMWQELCNLGYNCSPYLQAIWESDAFDGTTTPRLDDEPSYDEWRYANLHRLVTMSGVPAHKAAEIVSHLLRLDRTWTVKAVPGAREFIVLLRALRIKVGLCSNWDYPIQPYLEQAGLPKFDAITLSPQVGARKPHPKIFHDISDKLQEPPNRIIFVGDTWLSDIKGALHTGMSPVWIKKGKSSSGLSHLVPEFDTLDELYVWFASRNEVRRQPLDTTQ